MYYTSRFFLSPELDVDALAYRVARRWVLSGFIPDKFFKGKARELQALLKQPIGEPMDVSWKIHDLIIPLFKRFHEELVGFGMHRHALDSVQSRVDSRLRVLEKIADMWGNVDRALLRLTPDKSAQAETETAISIAIKEAFEKQVKTLDKALKVTWYIEPGSLRDLAVKILKKATPEELAAIEAAANDDWSTSTLNTKYAFFNRMKLEAKAARLIKKDKVVGDFPKWFESVRAMLEANYTEEAMAKREGFDDFKLGNLRVIVLDPEITHFENPRYLKQVSTAQAMLQRKGMSQLWYGVLFVVSKKFKKLDEVSLKAYRELGYASLESTAGTYHSGADVVKITAPPNERLVATIVHEMGHRYWYKFMGPEQRARFNGLVKTNPSEKTRDFPSGPEDEAGNEKPVTPVSDYGASSIEEAFAEVFERFVMGGDMSRDQLESFKSVLSSRMAQRVAARFLSQRRQRTSTSTRSLPWPWSESRQPSNPGLLGFHQPGSPRSAGVSVGPQARWKR